MRLGHAVLAGGISRVTLFGAELASAGYALFKLGPDLFASPVFKRIGTTAEDQHAADRDKDRKGPHPLILGTKQRIANCGLWNADCGFRGQNGDDCSIRTPQFAVRNLMIDSELLLQGYRLGVFPMAMEDDSIAWFSPDPRAIIPLENFHVPHDLRRLARRNVFEIKMDNSFGQVIRDCARRKDTWINHEIIESYERLHELGHAHSVEAWAGNELAGGLYGVAVGGAFFGESMFHRVRDASKIALVGLVAHLRSQKFTLLDTQWVTPHLEQFGAIEIPRGQYLKLLSRAVDLPRRF